MQLAGLTEQLTEQAGNQTFVPSVPSTVEELGIPASMIEQLILKLLHFRGEVLGRDLSTTLGLKFSLIEASLEVMKRGHLVTVKKSYGLGNITAMFALTEAGRGYARDYLDVNQYAGPVPVPIAQYAEGVRAQRLKERWLTQEALHEAYKHMVVSREVLSQIGPAVSSGKSFLIYGQPGNGKTYLAEALFNIQSEPIFVPYAIECQGTIIQLFDPIYHHRIQEQEDGLSAFAYELPYDGRWFRCPRPFIVTGGELALEMLDLSYNATSKIYDAPFQLKANNGIYLIDDFGRQKASPAEVLNRWIVPMERRVDFLSFKTGGKMQVPFEAFLIFSTNLKPEQLGDEAFLRRIQYKMLLRSPDVREFKEIFVRFGQSKGLECTEEMADAFLERHYRGSGKKRRRCHPRDVITHAIDMIDFERLPMRLTDEILDRAFESCFLASEENDE